MANSDTAFGLHNKKSYIWTQSAISWNMHYPTSIAQSNPCRIVFRQNHDLTDGSTVAFADIVGTTQLNGNTYYIKKINNTTFDLYTDADLSSGVNATGFTAYAEDESGSMTATLKKTVFADTDAAIDYFLTDSGKAVFNECATQLQWALVNDGNGDATNLKHTIAFGTKPNNPAAEDMWGAQFVSRRETLSAANNFTAKPWVTSDSDSHLF